MLYKPRNTIFANISGLMEAWDTIIKHSCKCKIFEAFYFQPDQSKAFVGMVCHGWLTAEKDHGQTQGWEFLLEVVVMKHQMMARFFLQLSTFLNMLISNDLYFEVILINKL
jgi:hypothetical protein